MRYYCNVGMYCKETQKKIAKNLSKRYNLNCLRDYYIDNNACVQFVWYDDKVMLWCGHTESEGIEISYALCCNNLGEM